MSTANLLHGDIPQSGATTAAGKSSNRSRFIPPTPLEVTKACVANNCEIALPLILAIHRQLTMTRREWTPLNKAIWISAGDPPEKKRERILRALKNQPELIRLRLRKTAISHYEVSYGKGWAKGG